ncbi:hypothetical protein BD779DRAFT_1485000 [Infundibulicybe gibba]|nr:hypothetical protein BD779DRAFT_1485000 [Infundibulicybe gibba]
MPTSTVPFEVLFEFTNNTADAATLQLTRGEDEVPTGGGMILLHSSESVSLVLNAGSTYKYALKQRGSKAYISVKAWQDTQCSVTDVLGGILDPESPPWTPIQGITVTCNGN